MELQPMDFDSLQDGPPRGGGGDDGGESELKKAKGPVAALQFEFDPTAIDLNVVPLVREQLSDCKGPCCVVLSKREHVFFFPKEQNNAQFASLVKVLLGCPLVRSLQLNMDLPRVMFAALCDGVAKSTTLEAIWLGEQGVGDANEKEVAYRAVENMVRENNSLLHVRVERMPWELLKSAVCHPKLQSITLVTR